MINDYSDWYHHWPKADLVKARAAVESGKVQIIHDGAGPNVTYTVGLTDNYRSPELIVTSFDDEPVQRKLVSKLLDQVRRKGGIPIDQEFRVMNRRATLKKVSKLETRKVASLAHTLYRGRFELAQCVFADPNGLYPWSLTDLVDQDYLIDQLPLYVSEPHPSGLWVKAGHEYERYARKYKSIELVGDVDPFPGHTNLFLTALDRAIAKARKAGGLNRFHHTDYRSGALEICFDFRADDVSEATQDAVEGIVQEAARMSRSTCVLCGQKANPSPRMSHGGADLPYCDKHDANLAYALLNFEHS